MGAPFGSPSTLALHISSWLPDGRIAFVQHCGTGCLGLHAVQSQTKEEYWDFCDASGELFWSPAQNVAVVENDASGVASVGLGLVSAADGIKVAKGASPHRPRKECKSAFKGEESCATCGPSQIEPRFNSWLPDSRTVLYNDAGFSSSTLKLWDVVSGLKRTLVANAASGAVSSDGRYVAFLSPESGRTINRQSNRVVLKILDLRSHKVVASRDIPTVRPPQLWSPSMVWSPSSSRLAFLGQNGKLSIATLKPDDIQVLETSAIGQDLSWSPDGKYLAIRDAPEPTPRLRIFKLASTEPSTIPRF